VIYQQHSVDVRHPITNAEEIIGFVLLSSFSSFATTVEIQVAAADAALTLEICSATEAAANGFLLSSYC